MSRERDRGFVKLKTLITLAVIGLIVYSCVKIVPVYVNNYELVDTMKSEARFAAVQRRNEEDVRTTVFKKAQDLGLPVRREDIKVRRTRDGMVVEVSYSVVVELPGYALTLNFSPSASPGSI